MLTGCGDYRPLLIELARGQAKPKERRLAMAHVELCADCARVLDEQMALSTALDGMADERLPDMAHVEAAVLAEFDRAAARRRASRWVFAAGLAAAVLVGLVAVERRTPTVAPQVQAVRSAVETLSPSAPVRPAVPVARARHRIVRRRSVGEESQPFLPIPYTVPLAPEERATIVRMDVPVAALIAAGYRVETPDPGGVVNAEVLVSQDGRARAIRLDSKEEEKQ
jgi:hypothetical protein